MSVIPLPTQKRYLSYLGFNTAYDVSKWCADRGIISAYVEMVVDGRQLAQSNTIQQSWWIRDAKEPGVVYERFSDIISRKGSIHQSKQWSASGYASAWLAAKYDMPVKPLEAFYSFYSAVAVDEIMEDVLILDHQLQRKTVSFTKPSDLIVDVRSKYIAPARVEVKHGSPA